MADMDNRDPFEILGVSPDAEVEVIQAAYRALARKYHPDSNPGADPALLNQAMSEINWAMEELDVNLARWRDAKVRPRPRMRRGSPPGYGPTGSSQAPTPSAASATSWTRDIAAHIRLIQVRLTQGGAGASIVIMAVILVAVALGIGVIRDFVGESAADNYVPTPTSYASGIPTQIQDMVMRDIQRREITLDGRFGELHSANLTGSPSPRPHCRVESRRQLRLQHGGLGIPQRLLH